MKTIAESSRGSFSRWLALVGILFHLSSLAADLKIPEVRTDKAVYTNVVVTSRSATDLIIVHGAGSMANIKIEDITNDEALIALGLKSAEEIARGSQSVMDRFLGSSNETMRVIMENPAWAKLESVRDVKWSGQMIGIVGGVALVIYLFGCYCMKLICVKAGHEPGGLIWVPLLHWISMFKAAGMSGWWILGLLVPLVNLIVLIVWYFKIVQVRRKSVLWAILLLFPVTNLIAFLYLAFSNGGEGRSPSSKSTPRSEPKSNKIKMK